jgi:hypothetical protein
VRRETLYKTFILITTITISCKAKVVMTMWLWKWLKHTMVILPAHSIVQSITSKLYLLCSVLDKVWLNTILKSRCHTVFSCSVTDLNHIQWLWKWHSKQCEKWRGHIRHCEIWGKKCTNKWHPNIVRSEILKLVNTATWSHKTIIWQAALMCARTHTRTHAHTRARARTSTWPLLY